MSLGPSHVCLDILDGIAGVPLAVGARVRSRVVKRGKRGVFCIHKPPAMPDAAETRQEMQGIKVRDAETCLFTDEHWYTKQLENLTAEKEEPEGSFGEWRDQLETLMTPQFLWSHLQPPEWLANLTLYSRLPEREREVPFMSDATHKRSPTFFIIIPETHYNHCKIIPKTSHKYPINIT